MEKGATKCTMHTSEIYCTIPQRHLDIATTAISITKPHLYVSWQVQIKNTERKQTCYRQLCNPPRSSYNTKEGQVQLIDLTTNNNNALTSVILDTVAIHKAGNIWYRKAPSKLYYRCTPQKMCKLYLTQHCHFLSLPSVSCSTTNTSLVSTTNTSLALLLLTYTHAAMQFCLDDNTGIPPKPSSSLSHDGRNFPLTMYSMQSCHTADRK